MSGGRILVMGATGMLGHTLVRSLATAHREAGAPSGASPLLCRVLSGPSRASSVESTHVISR